MKYTIKAGVLYKNESQLALVRIKSALLGPQRKILSIAGELLLQRKVCTVEETAIKKHLHRQRYRSLWKSQRMDWKNLC